MDGKLAVENTLRRRFTMHLYLRLLSETGVAASPEDARRLWDLLASAPAVNRIKGIELHPKGGYRVQLDVERELLDSLIEFLSANGLMSVI